MTALLLGLSLSNKLLEVGALAACAALVGIALLTLLLLSQGRELGRLREWAGRAPERAAELEQRIAAEVALRAQRVSRATPMIARPAAGQAAALSHSPLPEQPPLPTPTVTPLPAPLPGQPAFIPTVRTASAPTPAEAGEPAPATAAQVASAGAPPRWDASAVAAAVGGVEGAHDADIEPAVSATAPLESQEAQETPAAEPQPAVVAAAGVVAPATVAAAAGGIAGFPPASDSLDARAAYAWRPAPPARVSGSSDIPGSSGLHSAGVPVPAGIPAPGGIPVGASADANGAVAEPPLPPAPEGVRSTSPTPRAPVPSRPLPPRPPAPRAAVPHTAAAREAGGSLMPATPKFLIEEERSPRKALALIAAAAVVVVGGLAAVLLSGGGGGAPRAATTHANAPVRGGATPAHAAATSPAQIRVVVLNATETTGLAHALASNLRSSGYAQAQALSARPPSARSTSVVEYAGGHRTEAQRVAQALGIGETAPLEEAVAPLVEGASVVVIAGADKSSVVGGAGGGEGPAGEPTARSEPGAGEAAAGGAG